MLLPRLPLGIYLNITEDSLVLVLSVATLFSVILTTPVYGQGSKPINWLQICRNPIVDTIVTEPCETLTSPDGYTLTREGERVVGCVLGAGVLLYLDQTGSLLLFANNLAQKAGLCKSVTAPLEGGGSSSNNQLGEILGGLLGR
jgi:hypothetical protein